MKKSQLEVLFQLGFFHILSFIFFILEMCLISEAYSSSGHTSLMNVL
jgi:hypothetical protein